MKLVVTIKHTRNAAFVEDTVGEVGRCLDRVVEQLARLPEAQAVDDGVVRDTNGNTVGTWTWEA